MNTNGFDKTQISKMAIDLESEQIERTISTTDTDKFAQAVALPLFRQC